MPSSGCSALHEVNPNLKKNLVAKIKFWDTSEELLSAFIKAIKVAHQRSLFSKCTQKC